MTEATQQTESISFDNVNLNEIDPAGMKMPLGIPFKFQINEAAVKTYANDRGSGEYTSLKLTVTDDPNFSGRPFYVSFFPDKEGSKPWSAIKLRQIMDTTGVPQTGEFKEWLTELVTQRATFSAPLGERKQKDGTLRAEPDLFKCSPC